MDWVIGSNGGLLVVMDWVIGGLLVVIGSNGGLLVVNGSNGYW